MDVNDGPFEITRQSVGKYSLWAISLDTTSRPFLFMAIHSYVALCIFHIYILFMYKVEYQPHLVDKPMKYSLVLCHIIIFDIVLLILYQLISIRKCILKCVNSSHYLDDDAYETYDLELV